MEHVSFDPVEFDASKLKILLRMLSGEELACAVSKDVLVCSLKQAISTRCDLSVFDFQLVAMEGNTPTVAEDRMLISRFVADEVTKSIQMTMIKTLMSLERYEEKSFEEWREVAQKLQRFDIDDVTVLADLRIFLDKYPTLVNFQSSFQTSSELKESGLRRVCCKPLLGYAVSGCGHKHLRQQCVDELLKRGARVHIRHETGFLIDQARPSAFEYYLLQKKREFQTHERKAIAAWRDVSSKLCGEASTQVHNEDNMAKIVSEFCKKYPEMVNFQNNHAVNNETDEPLGYFEYSPLLSFAGAHACRRRRGGPKDNETTRRASITELLKHGARVDIFHGGRTSLEWMTAEGSLSVNWIKEQLEAPMVAQDPFVFQRQENSTTSNLVDSGVRAGRRNCILQ